MNVSINGKLYENVQWEDGKLSMKTEESLDKLELDFTPSMVTDVIVYDGDEEIAKYFNKGIDSMKVSGAGEDRTVEVVFILSRINEDAADELAASIDESNDAIMELGELISDFEESKEQYDGYQEEIDALKLWKNHIESNVLATIDARLARLENKVGGAE